MIHAPCAALKTHAACGSYLGIDVRQCAVDWAADHPQSKIASLQTYISAQFCDDVLPDASADVPPLAVLLQRVHSAGYRHLRGRQEAEAFLGVHLPSFPLQKMPLDERKTLIRDSLRSAYADQISLPERTGRAQIAALSGA